MFDGNNEHESAFVRWAQFMACVIKDMVTRYAHVIQ